jgi:hypothetical protein
MGTTRVPNATALPSRQTVNRTTDITVPWNDAPMNWRA